ncbi:hypothetical protein Tco_0811789 [Tanacetum coccineum]
MADGHVDYERIRRFLKETGRRLLLMVMRLLGLISLRWSATTATRGDILLGSAEFQETKTTGTGKKVRKSVFVPVETTTSNALVSCDGFGYD